MSEPAITICMDAALPEDVRRSERIGAFIDLELGDKSKWVLVYRDDKKRSFFATPHGRVTPMEAADVLQAMGRGLEALLKAAKEPEK